MSAIKNALQSWEDDQMHLDQALVQAQRDIASMTVFCWSGGDNFPVHAPDQEWIAETRTQLKEMLSWLEEMQGARDVYTSIEEERADREH